MTRVIVADAGPLIALAKISQIELLVALFTRICIPQHVLHEAAGNPAMPGATIVRDFADRCADIASDRDDEFVARLNREVDAGEAQAIALARELQCHLLIDDRIGRAVARRLAVPVIGVLGVLLQAKRGGHLARVEPCLTALTKAGCHVAQTLNDEALRLAGE